MYSLLVFVVGSIWLIACATLPLLGLVGLSDNALIAYSNTVQVTSTIVTAGLCLRAALVFDRGERMGRVWMLMGAGVLAWGVGAMLYAGYQFSHEMEDPSFPWFSDIGYLGIGPLVIASLYLFIREMQVRIPIWGIAVAAMVFLGSLGYGIWNNLESFTGEEATLLNSLALGLYVIFDPALLAMTVVSASLLAGGLVARPWWMTLAGLLFFFVGNRIYERMLANETYTNASWVNMSWPASFGLIAIGAMLTYNMFKQFEK